MSDPDRGARDTDPASPYHLTRREWLVAGRASAGALADGRLLAQTGAELRRMGARTQTVTTECAGNGRSVFHLPNTSGVQRQHGAVSTAEWAGIPFGELLERAGLGGDARHLRMEALDHAPLTTVLKCLRSLPRDVALGDALRPLLDDDLPSHVSRHMRHAIELVHARRGVGERHDRRVASLDE